MRKIIPTKTLVIKYKNMVQLKHMSKLNQFFIIMMFAFAGEIAAALIPLPVAGPIYGMIFLLAALATKAVPLKWVQDAADFVLGFLGLFFIAPAVAILEIFSDIRPVWPLLALILISTYLAVMASTGWVAQIMLRRRKK